MLVFAEYSSSRWGVLQRSNCGVKHETNTDGGGVEGATGNGAVEGT